MLLKFARATVEKTNIEKSRSAIGREHRGGKETRIPEKETHKKNEHTRVRVRTFARAMRARNASHQLKRTRFDKVSENNGRVLGSSFWNRSRKGGDAQREGRGKRMKSERADLMEDGENRREGRNFWEVFSLSFFLSLWMYARVCEIQNPYIKTRSFSDPVAARLIQNDIMHSDVAEIVPLALFVFLHAQLLPK